MDQKEQSKRGPGRIRGGRRTAAGAVLCGAALLAMGGCEVDSFFDPSTLGYWENTPTTVPILERLGAVEEVPEEFVEISQVTREDLIAQAQAYRLGPSDEIEVSIRSFSTIGRDDVFPRQIDQRGYISLPGMAPIYLLGKNEAEAKQAIADAVVQAQIILSNPVVSVLVSAQRQQTFSVIGSVRNPGQYFIPKPDYRLLEALTAAGGFDETLERVYVIRQVPLSEVVQGRTPPPAETPSTRIQPTPVKRGEDLIREIEELSKPKPKEPPPSDNPPPPPPPPPPGGGLSVLGYGAQPAGGGQPPAEQPPAEQPRPKPAIDLPEAAPQPAGPDQGAAEPPVKSKSRWVFLNGQWVKSARGAVQPGGGVADAGPGGAGEGLMTQRVIEVAIAPLVAGQSDVNIVIRPGDVVRVPSAETGLIYVTGSVSRAGTYALPPTGRMTIEQALVAAGGLSGLAIPERLDLTRRVGKNRQATIRLNMKAIGERTQPDVYLKPNDTINVGTNFWAYPLAVIRSGIRASYGYGFVLDRNFAGDVFGADQSISTR